MAPKSREARNRAFVDLTGFHFRGDFFDAAAGFSNAGHIGRRNRDHAVVFHVDGRAGFFRKGADNGTALADHVTDLFRIDLEGNHARSKVRELLGAAAGHFMHAAEDVLTAVVSLERAQPA